MTLTEKVAYLKGLAEGLDLDKDSKEGKLFAAMFDILEDMALTVSDIDEDLSACEDLEELEEYIFEEDECDCDCCDCDDYDCCCGDDEELYEIECPICGEELLLDGEMLDEEVIECPSCGEALELEIDFEDCDCGCDCCCDDEGDAE